MIQRDPKGYYEALGISHNATADAIRKAYRSLAFKYHPDKSNLEPSEAEKNFHRILDAYEVLSDPISRQVYDTYSLKAHALKDDTWQKDHTSQLRYTETSAFKGYNNSEFGFYTVYDKQFTQLSELEIESGADKKQFPKFGNKDLDTIQLKEFYACWLNFSTRRSFCWNEKWDIYEAYDRYERRIMEEENRKIRDHSKKEYNRKVLNIIQFVQKIDPRWIKIKMETQVETRKQREKELQKQREETEKRRVEKEKARSKQIQRLDDQAREYFALYGEDIYNTTINDTKKIKQIFNCEPCAKTFKSQNQLLNHERSSKHKQVQNLLGIHTDVPNVTEIPISRKIYNNNSKNNNNNSRDNDTNNNSNKNIKKKPTQYIDSNIDIINENNKSDESDESDENNTKYFNNSFELLRIDTVNDASSNKNNNITINSSTNIDNINYFR